MMVRLPFKQGISLKERLIALAQEAREKATAIPAGAEQANLLKKARQANTAAHIDDWVNSPGLQPPK